MDVLRVAQSLIPELEFIRAIKDRERNSGPSEFIASDRLEHLKQTHQFRILKNSTTARGQNFVSRRQISLILAFSKYHFDVLKVLSWVFTIKRKHRESPQEELVLIKGLGFQHLNPHVSPDEILDSIPTQALQAEQRIETVVILISQLPVSAPTGAIIVRNSFQALLLSQKPSISGLLRFIYQANILGLLAMINTEIRKILGEIPSALLLVNFTTKSRFLTLIDTQGSFENLDLMYYVKNQSTHVKSTIIHYSEGGMPFTRNQLAKNPFELNYELAPVDCHIVWTEEYSEFFNSRTPRENFLALGPQVFRSSNFIEKSCEPNLFKLAVFDETPSLLDESYEHMREEAGMRFLAALEYLWANSILDKEKQLKITFKQKRRNLESHSKLYLGKLDSLCAEGVVELLPWFTNPFEMISNADSVLTVIGSSPALIARHLEVPTAYGYFGSQELGLPIVNYNIPILGNEKELVDWIAKVAQTRE